MTDRRGDIQWLRAAAATEVVVIHSDLATKHFSDTSILDAPYASFGGIGVEVFFLVSGFIICMVAPRSAGAGEFLLTRIKRILPLYAIFTTLALLVQLSRPPWLLSPADLSLSYVAQSYLMWPMMGFPLLGPGWTLEHEMLFYEVVASVLVVAHLTGRIKLAVGGVLAVLGCVGCYIGRNEAFNAWTLHLLSPYMLLFSFGWLFRCAEESGVRIRVAIWAVGLCVLAIAFSVGNEWSRHLVTRIAVATALFCLAVLARRLLQADNPVNRAAWFLGDASFSLYLSHWFVLSVCGKFAGLLQLPAELELSYRIGAVVVAVLLGAASYKWVEVPLNRMMRGRSPAPGQLATAGRL